MRYPSTITGLPRPWRSRCDGDHKNAFFCRVLQKMSTLRDPSPTESGNPSAILPSRVSVSRGKAKIPDHERRGAILGPAIVADAPPQARLMREEAFALARAASGAKAWGLRWKRYRSGS